MILLDPHFRKNKITMATLVEDTGLSHRQVRRAVAEGLVDPPQGKGKSARYSEKTLHRLQVISKLMAQEVKPLGRKPTLPEIKSILKEMSEEQLEEIRGGLPFSFFDTGDPSDAAVVDTRLDHEYLDLHEKASNEDLISHELDDARPVMERVQSRFQSRHSRGTTFYHGELGDLGMLLQMLHDKLKTLVDDKYESDPTEGDTWIRIRTRSPIMEIHLKAPETETDKARLKALQRAVEKLIDQGYGPYYY